MDFSVFLDVVRALEHAEVEYILVGGVAVNLHGVVRATEECLGTSAGAAGASTPW